MVGAPVFALFSGARGLVGLFGSAQPISMPPPWPVAWPSTAPAATFWPTLTLGMMFSA